MEISSFRAFVFMLLADTSGLATAGQEGNSTINSSNVAADFQETNSTTMTCEDDPEYRDVTGSPCVIWTANHCNATEYNFTTNMTKEHFIDLRKRCPASCGLCTPTPSNGTPLDPWNASPTVFPLPIMTTTTATTITTGSTVTHTTTTTSITATIVCIDDDSYLDSYGSPCRSWKDFDCFESYGYMSQSGLAELREKCISSCGLCPTTTTTTFTASTSTSSMSTSTLTSVSTVTTNTNQGRQYCEIPTLPLPESLQAEVSHNCTNRMRTNQTCSIRCPGKFQAIGMFTCITGRFWGQSLCVEQAMLSDASRGLTAKSVHKIRAQAQFDILAKTTGTQSVPYTPVQEGIAAAIGVSMSYISRLVLEEGDLVLAGQGRRMGTRTHYRAFYEAIAPPDIQAAALARQAELLAQAETLTQQRFIQVQAGHSLEAGNITSGSTPITFKDVALFSQKPGGQDVIVSVSGYMLSSSTGSPPPVDPNSVPGGKLAAGAVVGIFGALSLLILAMLICIVMLMWRVRVRHAKTEDRGSSRFASSIMLPYKKKKPTLLDSWDIPEDTVPQTTRMTAQLHEFNDIPEDTLVPVASPTSAPLERLDEPPTAKRRGLGEVKDTFDDLPEEDLIMPISPTTAAKQTLPSTSFFSPSKKTTPEFMTDASTAPPAAPEVSASTAQRRNSGSKSHLTIEIPDDTEESDAVMDEGPVEEPAPAHTVDIEEHDSEEPETEEEEPEAPEEPEDALIPDDSPVEEVAATSQIQFGLLDSKMVQPDVIDLAADDMPSFEEDLELPELPEQPTLHEEPDEDMVPDDTPVEEVAATKPAEITFGAFLESTMNQPGLIDLEALDEMPAFEDETTDGSTKLDL